VADEGRELPRLGHTRVSDSAVGAAQAGGGGASLLQLLARVAPPAAGRPPEVLIAISNYNLIVGGQLNAWLEARARGPVALWGVPSARLPNSRSRAAPLAAGSAPGWRRAPGALGRSRVHVPPSSRAALPAAGSAPSGRRAPEAPGPGLHALSTSFLRLAHPRPRRVLAHAPDAGARMLRCKHRTVQGPACLRLGAGSRAQPVRRGGSHRQRPRRHATPRGAAPAAPA